MVVTWLHLWAAGEKGAKDDVDWRTRGCTGGVDPCDTLVNWEWFKMGIPIEA